MSQASPDC